ncbi:MAG: DUF58 domain-containing protein [Lachnospiraceae bacterium]|nr:DUF58 domain-containing protein [Lachnospiraceae bacterium]
MKLIIALIFCAFFYYAQLFIYRKFWNKSFFVDINFAKTVVREGDHNQLIEVITNDKILPLPMVQIKFAITKSFIFKSYDNSAITDQYYRNDYYSIMPYRRITRTYDFTSSKRGYYRMKGMDVICKDLFLSGMCIKSYKHEAAVCVLPARVLLEEFTIKARELFGEIVDRYNRNEDPFEYAGIREYRSYDPMNRINWKASAKVSQLRVNKFNTTFTQRVVIAINMECHIKWHEEDFAEEQIRLAATFADYFIQSHIPVALYSNGCDILTGKLVEVEAGADISHLRNIEIALARIKDNTGAGSFINIIDESLKNKTYDRTDYIIISNYRKNDLVELYKKIKSENIGVTWIIPEYGVVTPQITKQGDSGIIKWTVKNAN